MALQLPRLQRVVAIVDSMGKPLVAFHQWWQSVAKALETAIADLTTTTTNLTTTQADLVTTQADLTAAVADLTAAQADITAIQGDLTTFVLKDQAAFPTYTAYAGQTVSNPPTQAEMQALDDAVVTLATAFTSLKTALQTADVLT